ncbi:hypothetical protein BDR05DRAFT_1006165 [Suillus weaverae]|nr:hypothetical protein BDR05DRAFT_1006165 [Suillus weaverae]
MSKRSASSSSDEPNAKRARSQPSPLTDSKVWDILETFLTSKAVSYGEVLNAVYDYLGDAFIAEEWLEATNALFSGDDDDELSLKNFRLVRSKYFPDGQSTQQGRNQNSFLDIEAGEGGEDEVIVVDEEEEVTEPSSSPSPSLQEPPALKDPGAWGILERFLTTDLTYGQMEAEFHAYLGSRHRLNDWTDARLALFSGDDNNQLSLSNLLALKRKHIPDTASSASRSRARRSRRSKNPFIDLEAEHDEDDDDEQEADADIEHGRSEVTRLPARKHNLSEAIARIENNVNSSGSASGQRLLSVAPRRTTGFVPKSRMYVFTVNVPARQFVAEQLENRGLSVTVSPWIPSHLYITSDSPRTILAAVPDAYKASIKNWDCINEEDETAVNALRLQYPYPAWLRIKRGKYRDAIAYLFDSEQTNNFVTVLIPPREFPYDMPKGSVALFDPSRLPTGISTSDIIRDGEVVGSKYKGEEYYCGLLKKNFHRYTTELVHVPHPNDIRLYLQSGWDTPFVKNAEVAFSKLSLRAGDSVRLNTADLLGQICTVTTTEHAFGGSVNLTFELDGHRKEIQARLADVERAFNVGDEVRVVAGLYAGVEGHIVQKYDDNFFICQSGTQEEIEVSKYYLDRRPVDHTLQGYMSVQQFVDPPEEPKSIEIGDHITVTVGDFIGKSGLVQWSSGVFVWFQDETDLFMSDDRSDVAPPFMQVQATMVERTRLPATIKFTKERGYDVRPGDVVSVARGPEFRTKGVVRSVDFINAQLTLETENNHQLVQVPIRFVMKMRNADLDGFNKFINKEVFVVGGDRKGFRATLYGISTDDCVVAIHGQPRMTIKRCNVATTYGCRLNGAMLEWHDFTAFCEMRRKSYVGPPPRSITPPPEKITPVESGSSHQWASWSPEVLAAFSSQTDNACPSTEDPWTVNPSDSVAAVEPVEPNPRDPICWLKEFAIQFHTYHALYHVSVGFEGGKLDKRLAYSHCPDPFCGPNGPTPPGHIAVWYTAKTAGSVRVDYHIPVQFLTPAPPRQKNQECFIMNGPLRGGIRTVVKCSIKKRTVDLKRLPSSTDIVTMSFDDVCLVEPIKNM